MRRVWLTALLILTIAMPQVGTAGSAPLPQGVDPSALLASMTPEERIGQLFLVTFRGSNPARDHPIFSLIQEHHIGGVVLQRRSDNFVDAPDTAASARQLIELLQQSEFDSSFDSGAEEEPPADSPQQAFVPLLIGLSQEGNGAPGSQILAELTELPSPMALGATWDPELARGAGEILGRELEAIGINLLIGPSLDVLEDPRLGGSGELGVRTFGGDPYWVSLLGAAYIEGVHGGSGGRLAVFAKHFPGIGSSDRPLEEEVPTVRRSLDQLRQIELAPFFSVAGGAPGENAGIVDGFLTSHIRYQGLQGNIRDTTRPISLDRDALDLLMSLEPLPLWRQGGGVMMTDSLGSRAIRRFRDPLELTFRAHLVARDAFLAGNDLLYLSNFQAGEDPDEVTTIRSTLAFFAQKYREDPVFAQQVDQSVLRILQMKLRLYGGEFSLARVLPPLSALEVIGDGGEFTFDVARRAATLISPSAAEIEERLGGAPQIDQKIVFFTDLRTDRQCTNCVPDFQLGQRDLENRILTLYGSRAAGQVGEWNLTSYRMADLANFLGEPPTTLQVPPLLPPEEVEDALRTADWIIFSILNSGDAQYGSNALRLLLDRRPDIARDKKVVVFAFDVPYDLDATEISKLDVLFALYSKAEPFVEVAARLLFQELIAPGSAPVSIPGIGYDLSKATGPNPSQVITLEVLPAEGSAPFSDEEGFTVGDSIQLQTGVILDHNSHPVPDGTPVEFILSFQGESSATTLEIKAFTANGSAVTTLVLERFGLLSIRAQSGSAQVSEIVQLNVQEGIEAFVTRIAPTPAPTSTAQPTPTPVEATPTAAASNGGSPGESDASAGQIGIADLILGLIGIAFVTGGSYWRLANEGRSHRRLIRRVWITLIGGLIGYNYLAFGLPGAGWFHGLLGAWSALLLAVAGCAAAFAIAAFLERRG